LAFTASLLDVQQLKRDNEDNTAISHAVSLVKVLSRIASYIRMNRLIATGDSLTRWPKSFLSCFLVEVP